MSRFLAVLYAAAVCCVIVHGQPLANTELLTAEGDLAAQMVEGIDRYLMRRLAEAPQRRASHWARGDRSQQEFLEFRSEERKELARIIGAVDRRIDYDAPREDSTTERPSLIAAGPQYEVHAVRWPVFEGVEGEGLLLQPSGPPRGYVVALPDADWTPEMLVGLERGAPTQFARRLVESGFLVVVPALINREDTYSGRTGVRFTNQPHREFIYRMAYEMGRHIIGYEVQKVLSLVDWFEKRDPEATIGVIGYGEGGLLALCSAAIDVRIDAAAISGYFAPRENVWQEPIYRNLRFRQ